MNRKVLNTAVAAVIGIMISGSIHAGNTPNTTRTLTRGIGSGITHGQIPSSHPGTKSRAAAYRNSNAADYTSKFRSGLSHRPTSSGSSYSGKRPTSVPGADRWNANAEANARSRIPAGLPPTSGSNPGSGASAGTGIPSSVSTGIPSSVNTGIPSSVNTGGAPVGLPPALPAGATEGMEKASGHMSTHVPGGVPDAAFSGLSNRPTDAGRP